MSRPAASTKARKSRSRVSSGILRSTQLWAMSASPRRALRPRAIIFDRSRPALSQKPPSSSSSGTPGAMRLRRREGRDCSIALPVRPGASEPGDRAGLDRATQYRRPVHPQEMRSKCSCPRRSTVRLQLRETVFQPHFAAELTELIISVRRGEQLQSGSDGLSDPGAAGLLRFREEVFGDFHGDLAGGSHEVRIPYTIPASYMVSCGGSSVFICVNQRGSAANCVWLGR